MLGLSCHWLEPKIKKNGNVEYWNAMDENLLQLGQFNNGKYSKDRIIETYKHNLTKLKQKLPIIYNSGIRFFRISSNLLPLFDKIDDSIKNDNEILNLLKEVGLFITNNNMRVNCHPGQYTLLSSNNSNVIENSIKDLAYHAWIFDKMNLPQTPYYNINIHGGVKGNSKLLIETINKLPDNIKSRLTLENDERAFSIKQLYQVYKNTGIPIVFDSHHHEFNQDSLSSEEAMELAFKTWSVKPTTHLSNTTPGMENGSFNEKRKHSDYISYVPDHQRLANNNNLCDIEIEAKQKNLAILKMIKEIDIIL